MQGERSQASAERGASTIQLGTDQRDSRTLEGLRYSNFTSQSNPTPSQDFAQPRTGGFTNSYLDHPSHQNPNDNLDYSTAQQTQPQSRHPRPHHTHPLFLHQSSSSSSSQYEHSSGSSDMMSAHTMRQPMTPSLYHGTSSHSPATNSPSQDPRRSMMYSSSQPSNSSSSMYYSNYTMSSPQQTYMHHSGLHQHQQPPFGAYQPSNQLPAPPGQMSHDPQNLNSPRKINPMPPPATLTANRSSEHSRSSTGSNANPGPIPASTPRVISQSPDGIQKISFEYSRDRVKVSYTIDCNVDSVDVSKLSKDFKENNCVYPRACGRKEDYKGNRWNYETECNEIAWALASLNESIQNKRGLIQRAVDSWRNSAPDHKLRSRRVRRMAKNTKRQISQTNGSLPNSNNISIGRPHIGSVGNGHMWDQAGYHSHPLSARTSSSVNGDGSVIVQKYFPSHGAPAPSPSPAQAGWDCPTMSTSSSATASLRALDYNVSSLRNMNDPVSTAYRSPPSILPSNAPALPSISHRASLEHSTPHARDDMVVRRTLQPIAPSDTHISPTTSVKALGESGTRHPQEGVKDGHDLPPSEHDLYGHSPRFLSSLTPVKLYDRGSNASSTIPAYLQPSSSSGRSSSSLTLFPPSPSGVPSAQRSRFLRNEKALNELGQRLATATSKPVDTTAANVGFQVCGLLMLQRLLDVYRKTIARAAVDKQFNVPSHFEMRAGRESWRQQSTRLGLISAAA